MTMENQEPEEELLALARDKFTQLTDSEVKFFKAIQSGKIADYSTEDDSKNNLTDATSWGNERCLRADRIAWICQSKKASSFVTNFGIAVRGVRIDEVLELAFLVINFPLDFTGCYFNSSIVLINSRLHALKLSSSFVNGIVADGITVETSVLLRDGFCAIGELRFPSAQIGSSFYCTGAILDKNGQRGDNLSSSDSTLNLQQAKISGSVFLDGGFKSNGHVNLTSAKIGGNLYAGNGSFYNKDSKAFSAENITVGCDVMLTPGFLAEGEVRFIGAVIGQGFGCEGGLILNKGGVALAADGIEVRRGIFLRYGFHAEGEVRFLGSNITGNFECDGSQFHNASGRALSLDGSTIKGDIFLRDGFDSVGLVSLNNVVVHSDVVCTNSSFLSTKELLSDHAIALTEDDNLALSLSQAEIGNSVWMNDGFRCRGTVALPSAHIKNNLIWTNVQLREDVTLDLTNTFVGTLCDDENSWPSKGNLYLHGFTYDWIHLHSTTNVDLRIDWINRQPQTIIRPNSYEQLASVLKKTGLDDEATSVLISKAKLRSSQIHLKRFRWSEIGEFVWYKFLGKLIGYGYRPWYAFLLGIVFFLSGWGIFECAFQKGMMVSSQENRIVFDKRYEPNSFIFSLDCFLPIVDLQQENKWSPDLTRWSDNVLFYSFGRSMCIPASFFCIYFWIHILAGWILSSLFIVGLTGVIKNGSSRSN